MDINKIGAKTNFAPINNLKYKKQKQISNFFGKWLGEELSEIDDYNDIDLVIPVPLHKQKLKKRGYNQAEILAKSFAKNIASLHNSPV